MDEFVPALGFPVLRCYDGEVREDDLWNYTLSPQSTFQDHLHLRHGFAASTVIPGDPGDSLTLHSPLASTMGYSTSEPHYSWSTVTSVADSGDSASSTLDTNPAIYSCPSETVETSSPAGESSKYEIVCCLKFWRSLDTEWLQVRHR